ncbi:hypothetical protein [Pseudomonas sp. PLMAX]|uniref:hypothetical protein n=1 Tax=Pseudomonas sp. PLMAX TaxID=2201998 RepID=UPI0038BC54C1
MTRLKYLLEQFGLMFTEGRHQVKSLKLESSADLHQLSFAETLWPDVKSVAFKPVEFKAQVVPGEEPAKTLLRAMVTAPESVNKVAKLFNTYNLDRNLKWFFEEIKEVQQLHKNNLKMFDAFTQPGTQEVEAYFVRPECAQLHPQLFSTAQISPKQSTIDDLCRLGMYRKAALLSVPATVAPENVAEFAYSALQNEQSSWSSNQDIINLTDFPRSMQVGDVFIIGSHGHVVKGMGFEKLDSFFPRDPEAEVARHDWSSEGPGL